MKFSFIVFLFISSLFTTNLLHADSLFDFENGGSASLGDLKHQVCMSCGEPESKEIIGYVDKVLDNERIRVMKIEEWIYSTSFYGEKYFFSLKFEGNKLVEIRKGGYR